VALALPADLAARHLALDDFADQADDILPHLIALQEALPTLARSHRYVMEAGEEQIEEAGEQ